MSPNQSQQLILDLTKKLNQYSDEYYQHGESSVDDQTFDTMLQQLQQLEIQYPQWKQTDSPTQRVGGKALGGFMNIRHQIPMLSLANIYNLAELTNWYTSMAEKLDQSQFPCLCELKIDGVAMTLLYEKGILKQALTRGDGYQGDDVTNNVKTIRILPLQLPKPVSLEVRGEIYLPKARFEKINKHRAQEELPLFRNPRNAAAGTLRLHDSQEVNRRGLSIFIYDLVKGKPHESNHLNLAYLKELGFQITPYQTLCYSLESIMSFCHQWQQQKSLLPFDIDGIVIKVDLESSRQILGSTVKTPRWAVAWKFTAEQARTRLINIENSIGRTGIITPVANLEPTMLSGSQIQRATLHNYAFIERLGIYQNDLLIIEKGGEIIPKVVGIDYTQRYPIATPIKPPTSCPNCQTLLQLSENNTNLKCLNPSCSAIIQAQMEHFVSKKGMNIEYLGPRLIQQLIQQNLIQKIPDLYTLFQKREALILLEGFGKKSADNLLQAIDHSKNVFLHQYIYALGIPHIGAKAAKNIANIIKTPADLLSLTFTKLEPLQDFGAVMIESILNWIKEPLHQKLIMTLKDYGVNPQPDDLQQKSSLQKIIVITGTLQKSREDWTKILQTHGFNVTSSISKKTNYLLAGQNPGSKLTKAEQLNIKILNEEEMINILNTKKEL